MKHTIKYCALILCIVFSMIIIAPCNATNSHMENSDTKIVCPDTFNAPLGKATTFPVQLMMKQYDGSWSPAPWRNLRFKIAFNGCLHEAPQDILYNHMFWTDWSNGNVNFKYDPGKVNTFGNDPRGYYDLNITYSGNIVSGVNPCWKFVRVIVT
jgi:hypothetical protein